MTQHHGESLWLGLTRGAWIMFTYVFVIGFCSFGLFMAYANMDDIADEILERQARDCQLIANNRAAIIDILNFSYAKDGLVDADEKSVLRYAEELLDRNVCPAN